MISVKWTLTLSYLQRFSQAFLDAVFPSRCLICGTFDGLHPPDGGIVSDPLTCVTASYFCESCRKELTPIGSPFCSKCGLPFVSRKGESHTCSECLTEEKYFRRARAFGVYDGALMEAIHAFKYGKRASLSRPLAALARQTFLQFWDNYNIDLLVPVPLHLKRLRQRGFNQAHLLINRWAKLDKTPFDGLVLSRTRWTEPQTSLSRKERQKNIKKAFSVKRPESVEGRRIVLVDDVYTTGSTANECARVLMKAGAEFVDVLTLARAL